MFDHIHFNIADSSMPLTNTESLEKELTKTEKYSHIPSFFAAFSFFENCQFCIDGKSWVLPPRPITDFARENFLFVQSFSMMDARSNFYTRRRDADSFMILFTYEGEGSLRYKCIDYPLNRGDGILIDCSEEHFYRTVGKHWKHSVLHFSGRLADYLYEAYSYGDTVKFHQEIDGQYQMQLEHLLGLYEEFSPYRELMISNTLENILVNLLTDTAHYAAGKKNLPENLQYLVHYINNNYTQPLTLGFLSEFSNLDKYYLCKLFRKHIGFSPIEYIKKQRIEHAKALLKNTSLSAKQVGIMVGFDNENYFYRVFKKETGFSPISYRNL